MFCEKLEDIKSVEASDPVVKIMQVGKRIN